MLFVSAALILFEVNSFVNFSNLDNLFAQHVAVSACVGLDLGDGLFVEMLLLMFLALVGAPIVPFVS